MEIKNEKLKRELAIKTNFIFAIAIVQEGLIKDIESKMRANSLLKFTYKQKVNAIKKNAEELRAIINRFDPENAEQLGEEADKIEEVLLAMIE
jgi:hypothetical protein